MRVDNNRLPWVVYSPVRVTPVKQESFIWQRGKAPILEDGRIVNKKKYRSDAGSQGMFFFFFYL